MASTTVKMCRETKELLNEFKEYKNESYDEVVRKLVYIAKTAKKDPKLSSKTVKGIEEARERMRKGEFYTEKEMKELLGMK
jgi:hypothetical protein